MSAICHIRARLSTSSYWIMCSASSTATFTAEWVRSNAFHCKWPLCLLDLTACHFWLWDHPKSVVCKLTSLFSTLSLTNHSCIAAFCDKMQQFKGDCELWNAQDYWAKCIFNVKIKFVVEIAISAILFTNW